MSKINLIKVNWDFDIDPREYEGFERKKCDEMGVPYYVDLDLFFEEPREVSGDHIADALSDEYGWLIFGWKWVIKDVE